MSDLDVRRALGGMIVLIVGLLSYWGIEVTEALKSGEDRLIKLESRMSTIEAQMEDAKNFRDRIVTMMIQNKERALIP